VSWTTCLETSPREYIPSGLERSQPPISCLSVSLLDHSGHENVESYKRPSGYGTDKLYLGRSMILYPCVSLM